MALVITEPKRKRVTGQVINLPKSTADMINIGRTVAAEEAEEAIIGAVLRESVVFIAYADQLQAGDFYSRQLGFSWYAFEHIVDRGEDIDLVTFSLEMERLGQWRGDLDMLHFSTLIANAPSADNIEAYIREVRDAATRLRGLEAAADMINVWLNRKEYSVEAAKDESHRLLYEATDQRVNNTSSSIASIVGEYFDEMEIAITEGIHGGMPTGFSNIDTLLGGVGRGEMIVWCGGDGMGKTSLILSAARLMAIQLKLRVVIFSLEQLKSEIVRHFISMETGIPKLNLKNHDLSPEQWSRFVKGTAEVASWSMHIFGRDEYPTLTPIQARRILRRLMFESGVDVVIIDGLWLMEDSNGETDRPRAVGNITRDLLAMTEELQIGLHLTHQYNNNAWSRPLDKRRPQRDDIAESIGVRRNAPIIIGLYRDKYYQIEPVADVTEGHIIKDRNGSGAQGKSVEWRYLENRSMFEEIR